MHMRLYAGAIAGIHGDADLSPHRITRTTIKRTPMCFVTLVLEEKGDNRT